MNTFWSAKGPATLDLDLQGYYDLESINVIPYYDGSRFYHYEVYVSSDGEEYTLYGEKKTDEPQTKEGENFVKDSKAIRFVQVRMISNSLNSLVHVNEIHVMGVPNTTYIPPADSNEGSLALNCPVRTYADKSGTAAANVTDGDAKTSWSGNWYPAYCEIDLQKNVSISSIQVIPAVLSNPDDYVQYSLYTSLDGENFTLAGSKQDKEHGTLKGETYELDAVEARYVRVLMEYSSAANYAALSEVRVYGEETGSELQEKAPIQIEKFENTDYAKPVTEDETIAEVRGIVSRTVGEQYNDWFEFVLEEDENAINDWYEIDMNNGKVRIRGNKGLSLTTGLNCYYKYFCNVEIAQQTRQTKMPEQIVEVTKPIRKESPYEVRYAYNYCTHSYTMAFWQEEEWQNELDWLALNGYNAILDITGQEEVWRRFLGGLGYNDEEVQDWLVGPGYFGWMYMANMKNLNGPIPRNWLARSTELARSNQRKMRALGITPILQGYSGMIPNNITEKDSSIEIIPQGLWNGIQRPGMLKTNSETYTEMAAKFYQAQKEVYGDWAHYYATDPLDEGGKTGGITRDIVGRAVLDNLKAYDENCTWVIQSWSFQPELLEKITAEEKLNNILMLDLDATRGSKYGPTEEFAGSKWTCCMLENYGGRTGIVGNLTKISQIPSRIKAGTEHMVGMGITPEGTNSDPAKYDLFGEMMWESEDIDVNEWLDHYLERRYGKCTENAREALNVLLQTAYKDISNYKTPPESVINALPQFNATKAAPNGSIGRHYNKTEFENALTALMKDYDELKDSAGYQYDVNTILRQCIANSAENVYKSFTNAYAKLDTETFDTESERFLDIIRLQNDVLNSNKVFMLGTWLAPSTKAAADQDDFTKRIFNLNAKGIVTTWASYYAKGVYDYANREYGGLTEDYYGARWKTWIDRLSADIHGDRTGAVESMNVNEGHEFACAFARNEKEYPTEPSGDVFKLYQEFVTKFALNKPVTTLTSDLYDIDDTALTVNKVPTETTVTEFLSNVNLPAGSTVKVRHGEDIIENDTLISKDDTVTLSLADGTEQVYTIGELVEPADFSKLNEWLTKAEGVVESDCTPESWEKFNKTVTEAIVVQVNPDATQVEIDEACGWMEQAFKDLVIVQADYSKVNEYKALAESKNAEDYKDFNKVTEALNAIEEGLPKSKQAQVDQMAENLKAALDALEEKDADYTELNKLKDQASELNAKDYKNFAAVTEALNAIKEGLPKSKQSEVDQMAKDLKAALDALVEKDADYTALNKLKDQANALKAEDYKNFAAVTNALNAIKEGLPKSKQAEVDQMAKDLKAALEALQKKMRTTRNWMHSKHGQML